MKVLTLFPAYGRDYPNGDEALADWNTDKDWKLSLGGPYVNKAQSDQLKADGYTHVRLVYRKSLRSRNVEL